MIKGQHVLALIPARGGSKGVPRKNVRMVGGKPLIAWTIEAARNSSFIDAVVVSTDDAEIAAIACAHGAEIPFMRGLDLSSDTARSIDVALDAIERCPGYQWVVLLQPTSPLRNARDIDQALSLCINSKSTSCVSLTEVEAHPDWMFTLGNDSTLTPYAIGSLATRRQDLPSVYTLNGAIYVADTDWLVKNRSFIGPGTIGYEMPRERSLDIDEEMDFKMLELLTENH